MKEGMIRLMDGHLAKRPVPGFCRAPIHPGALTIRLLKHKRCVEKGCRWLRKNEEHPLWKAEEKRKKTAREHRKMRKEKIREWTEEQGGRDK